MRSFTKETGILETCDPKTTAVLVVDIQHSCCGLEGEAMRTKYLSKAEAYYLVSEFAPRVAAFLKEARARGFRVIHTRIINPNNINDNQYIDLCRPIENDQEFTRYSAHDTIFNLEGFLNWTLCDGGAIEKFIILGVYSNICVAAHALRAKTLGYAVVVPPELTFP